ncbi:DUF6234 family protein [Actinokineospora diospyrosa]|uniref:Uncharacterized protein n=1 Tax=Actinokineospora diospyrosa TaxID=103728 RepID=A0ABT1IIW1_9PSEU|nr:DUF6234 family protein [Actinokineospora diospyrosa]MCP2272585.1 hypothetical protein [Actinokineospora diospyrosa]
MTVEERPDQRLSWLLLVWVLLFCTWLFGVPLLVLQAAFTGAFTPVDTAADLAERDRLTMWAEIVAVGVPLVGVLLAAITRRRAPAVVFGILLFLSVAVAGYNWAYDARHNPAPATTPEPRICQEHSGGDNRCPGN